MRDCPDCDLTRVELESAWEKYQRAVQRAERVEAEVEQLRIEWSNANETAALAVEDRDNTLKKWVAQNIAEQSYLNDKLYNERALADELAEAISRALHFPGNNTNILFDALAKHEEARRECP